MLLIPNTLEDFVNSGTETEMTSSGREAYCFHGDLYYDQNNYICRDCGCRMEIHNRYHVQLRHVCIGDKVTFVMVDHVTVYGKNDIRFTLNSGVEVKA